MLFSRQLSYFSQERALVMIALISPANNHPLLKKDQSYDAFIKSYCNFGFGGRVGLLDFCDQLGRACITWLLRAASYSSPSWYAVSSSFVWNGETERLANCIRQHS